MARQMSDDPAYIVELSGLADATEPDNATADENSPADGKRRWIGVRFECCGVYARIYRNPNATAYSGYCPRCQRRLSVPIGPGGTDQRIFRAQ